MRRLLRCDGLLPAKMGPDGKLSESLQPGDVREMKSWLDEHQAPGAPFDIVWEGETPGDSPRAAADIVRPWAEAGVTWWIETRWMLPRDAGAPETLRHRILQGPPRID